MRATPQLTIQTPGNLLSRFAEGWTYFWFHPADPLPLGLVRICAGLVILYTHLVYTFDLQEMMGEHAWLDLPTINEYRWHQPFPIGPLGEWEDPSPKPPPLPEPPPWLNENLSPLKREEARNATPPEQREKAERHYAEQIQRIQTYKNKPMASPDVSSDEERIHYFERFGWDAADPHMQARGQRLFSVWFHVTDPTAMAIVHTVFLVAMLCLTLGLCTRVTSVITWLGVLCYTQRVPTSVFGMDTIMIVASLYLMIGPSGAALSLDRLIARYWASWRALRAHRRVPDLSQPAPSISANLALRLLQIHVCIIYGASGLFKLQGQTWLNGTATWLVMVNPEFSPVRFQLYTDAMRFLASHPFLWQLFVTLGVVFTLVFEIGFPFLIWLRKMRPVMMTAAFLLHAGIAVHMGLTTFSLMMISIVLAFASPEAIRWLLAKIGRGPAHFRLAFSGRARGQVRAASAIHAFDVWQQVELQEQSTPAPARKGTKAAGQAIQAHPPARSAPVPAELAHLQLVTDTGTVLTGYRLYERLVRSLRPLWPLALFTWIPGAEHLGSRLFPGMQQASATTSNEPVAAQARPDSAASAVTHVKPKA
jgi:hypothetical protein